MNGELLAVIVVVGAMIGIATMGKTKNLPGEIADSAATTEAAFNDIIEQTKAERPGREVLVFLMLIAGGIAALALSQGGQ